jgi:adenylosuccinate lyase
MFNRYEKVIENLNVYPDNMLKNIYLTKGIIFSQRVLTKLIDKGLTREEAYDQVQSIANDAYNNNKDFLDLLLESSFISDFLDKDEVKDCFNLDFYQKKVDYIYGKVFK